MVRALRLARARVRRAVLWRLQGRRTDVPVVVRAGQLLIQPDGQKVIYSWYLDCTYMSDPTFRLDDVDQMDRLWESLARFTTPEWVGAQNVG